jgi:hypothetical protein
LWAGTIVLFASLAATAVAAGVRRHGTYAALGLAVTGVAALAYVQFVEYSAGLEVGAFGLLAAGVALDFLRRRDSDVSLA